MLLCWPLRPYRLVVRTEPSQGLNRGSTPRRVTKRNFNFYTKKSDHGRSDWLEWGGGSIVPERSPARGIARFMPLAESTPWKEVKQGGRRLPAFYSTSYAPTCQHKQS